MKIISNNKLILKNPYLFYIEVDKNSTKYVGSDFIIEKHFSIYDNNNNNSCIVKIKYNDDNIGN